MNHVFQTRTEPNQNHFEPNPSFFYKNRTEIKKSILPIPTLEGHPAAVLVTKSHLTHAHLLALKCLLTTLIGVVFLC